MKISNVILTILISYINSICDNLAASLNEQVTNLYQTMPSDSDEIIKKISSKGQYLHNIINLSQLENSLKQLPIHEDVIKKIKIISYAKEVFYQSFSFVIVNHEATLEEYVATAKFNETTNQVEYAIIKISISGPFIQEYKIIVGEQCSRVLFFKSCDKNLMNIPSGYTFQKIMNMNQVLKALGYRQLVKEINSRFTYTSDSSNYAKIYNLFMDHITELNKQNENYEYNYYYLQNVTIDADIHYDYFDIDELDHILTTKHTFDVNTVQKFKESLNTNKVFNIQMMNIPSFKIMLGYIERQGPRMVDIYYMNCLVKGELATIYSAVYKKDCHRNKQGKEICTNKLVNVPRTFNEKEYKWIRQSLVRHSLNNFKDVLSQFSTTVHYQRLNGGNCAERKKSLIFLD